MSYRRCEILKNYQIWQNFGKKERKTLFNLPNFHFFDWFWVPENPISKTWSVTSTIVHNIKNYCFLAWACDRISYFGTFHNVIWRLRLWYLCWWHFEFFWTIGFRWYISNKFHSFVFTCDIMLYLSYKVKIYEGYIYYIRTSS